jgi:hypothetical protein
MVTHDVGLKNFATKIIRMLDGKIQQITENPIEQRGEHIDNLAKLVESYKHANEEGHQDLLGVRAGRKLISQLILGTKKREEVGEDKEGDLEQNTKKSKFEFRKPTDYAAIAFKHQSHND